MWPRVDGLRAMELGEPGPQRSRLNAFVLDGTKRATAGLLADYADEPIEQVGERMPLVDDHLAPLAMLVVTAVAVVPFEGVTWEFAQAEGFVSLGAWREAHQRFWGGRAGDAVCVRFELLPLVRRALPADLPGIVALRAVWSGHPTSAAFEADATAWLEGQAAVRQICVAILGGEVVAFVTVLVCERMPRTTEDGAGRGGGRWGYVGHMFTAPARRRQGVGEALIAAVVQACRAEGFDRLVLNPSAESVPFWSSLGFRPPATLLELPLR